MKRWIRITVDNVDLLQVGDIVRYTGLVGYQDDPGIGEIVKIRPGGHIATIKFENDVQKDMRMTLGHFELKKEFFTPKIRWWNKGKLEEMVTFEEFVISEELKFIGNKKRIIAYNPLDPYGEEDWDEIDFKELDNSLYVKKTSKTRIVLTSASFEIYLKIRDNEYVYFGTIGEWDMISDFEFRPSYNIKKGNIKKIDDDNIYRIVLDILLIPIHDYFNKHKDLFDFVIKKYLDNKN